MSKIDGMHFPVIFHPFGLAIHAHLLMEIIAYTAGFQLFLYLRRRRRDETIEGEYENARSGVSCSL